MANEKQLRWSNIALIAFVAVWGLGNVVNNFALQGLSVVTSWILIMIIYFIPYTLIVGQLGSTFKDAEGGRLILDSSNEYQAPSLLCCLDLLDRAHSVLSTKTPRDSNCIQLAVPR